MENTIGFTTGPYIRLDINNNAGGGSTGCNGPESLNASVSGSPAAVELSDDVFHEFQFIFGEVGIHGTLEVTAFPTNSGGTKTVRVRKIVIAETPPGGSFTIAPTSIIISCGSTTSQTFTITNVNNTQNITDHSWNLGATPNGWLLPNGAAAPATYSTGATNTLTLTPDCGKALSNVSATVAANGNNYNTTNSSAISITQPSYSISGSSTLCSGSTPYSINGLVCNSSILWAGPPSNFGSLSSLTSSPTTLSYGGTSGIINLTANVTSCAVATPVTLPVHVGPYTTSDYTLSGNNGSMYWCPNQSISFTVSGAGASNYIWSPPAGWTTVYNGGSYVAIRAPTSPNPPSGTLSVSFTEPCGTTITLNKYLAFNSIACTTSPYTVSPNPASSTLTIACTSLQTYCNIAAVEITDMYGTVLSSNTWPYTNQQVQVSVSFLQNGSYIVRTYSGTQWYSNQFMVQH